MLNRASLLLLAAAVLFLLGAWLLWSAASRKGQHGAVRARLESLTGRVSREPDQRTPGSRYGFAALRFVGKGLYRAGLSLSPQAHNVLLGAPVAVFPFLAAALGVSVALIPLLAYPVFLYLLLLWKVSRFGKALVEQMPGFLDGVSRSLAVGNTMPVAIRLTIEKSPDPVQRVFDQVLRRHELGASVEDALQQVARSYDIRELSMLASVISVNARFGGKVEPVLTNISTAIREKERARRELLALTAETRFSAWLLSGMPVGVAAMMAAFNPRYIYGMWTDPTGHWLLLGAFGLEVVGTLLLFRMSRI